MRVSHTPKTVVLAGAVAFGLVAWAHDAVARDSSIQDFFAEQFGLGSPRAPETAPVWSEDNPYDRPLVVRPHHRKARNLARAEVPVSKGPVGPVSIYEDKTLRRGDAVMTAHGMRVFKGSATMPYQESDFIALSDHDGLPREVTKTLIAMDHVSRD